MMIDIHTGIQYDDSMFLAAKSILRSFIRQLSVLGLFLLLSFFCYPFLFNNFATNIYKADRSDLLYILSIIQFSINAPLSMIYHLPFYYPTAWVTTFGHPLFGISLIFKFFQALGFSFIQSTNLYIILALCAGAFGCWLLAREAGSDSRWAMVFAAFYILFRGNSLYFIWLNFLSSFWVPYVFFFLLRYLRSGRWYHLVLGAFCSFYQFFTEIYYGIHLLVFLIPLFFAAALLLKLISWRRVFSVLIAFLAIGLLIMVLFHPFLSSANQHGFHRSFRSIGMIQPCEVFNYSTILAVLKGTFPPFRSGMFPGFMIMSFFFAFFALSVKRSKLLLAILITLGIALALLVFSAGLLYEVIFLVLLSLLGILTLLGWKNYSLTERLLLITSSIFFLLLLNFRQLQFLNYLSPYRWFYNIIPGMNGLRIIKRIFPIFFPFWITIAALAANRLESVFFRLKGGLRWLIPLLVLVAITLENFNFNNFNKVNFRSLPKREAVYNFIPCAANKVVFEWPFFFSNINFQKITCAYMFSTGFHKNSLLNGSTSFRPTYLAQLEKTVGGINRDFPTENKVRRLLENYSVDYIVFHLHLLNFGKKSYKLNIDDVRARVESMRQLGQIVYRDHMHLLLRLRETKPLISLIRTYSLYHLKRNIVRIAFSTPYNSEWRVFLNGIPVNSPVQKGTVAIHLDLHSEKLLAAGNRLKVIFSEPVLIASVSLISKK